MPRKYRKRRRADLEDETRRRITEALVELHGSIGPLRTTIQAVAAQAGVQRATVYRHFPDELSMFAACSVHWSEENPLPDPSAWAALGDPNRRMRMALGELYGFYARNQRMLANIFRDEALVDALGPAMQTLRNYFEVATAVIVSGFKAQDSDLPVVRAAVGHAISFSTWSSLTQENGLSQDGAISMMAGMIERGTDSSGRVRLSHKKWYNRGGWVSGSKSAIRP